MRFDNGVFELAAGRSSQLPAGDLPEIVFSGKSNVGKSSLISPGQRDAGKDGHH